MTPRCPLCGGVVVGAHFHGIDPEQRCDACDTLAELRGASVCACSLADLRRALAGQAAGEAERVRAAVAAEREACAQIVDCMHGPACADPECRYARDARVIRARATSPAPEPVAAERAVIDAAVRLMTPPSAAGDATAIGPRLHGAILDLQAARAAERKGGG